MKTNIQEFIVGFNESIDIDKDSEFHKATQGYIMATSVLERLLMLEFCENTENLSAENQE